MFKPSIRQIEYFLKVSETLSFSRAAEQLYITQSAVSNAINELETGLRLQLFERSSRRVFLTDAGQQLKTKLAPLLESYIHTLSDIENMSDIGLSNIRLGIIPTIAPYILAPLLKHAHESNPNTSFSITEGLTKDVLEKLDNNDIDVGLIALPYPLQSQYKTLELFDDPLYLATSNEHAKHLPKTIKPNDFNDLNLLLLEDGHCLRDQAIQTCKVLKNQIESDFAGTSLATILSLVGQNQGQSLVPEMLISHYDSNDLGVTFLPLANPRPKRTIALVWSYEFSKIKANLIRRIVTKLLH